MKFLISFVFQYLVRLSNSRAPHFLGIIGLVFAISCGNEAQRQRLFVSQSLSQLSFDLELTFNQATSGVSLKAVRKNPVPESTSDEILEWSVESSSRFIGKTRQKISKEVHLLIKNDIAFTDRMSTWKVKLNDSTVAADLMFPGTVGLTWASKPGSQWADWNLGWSIQRPPENVEFLPKFLQLRFTQISDKAKEKSFPLPLTNQSTSGIYKVESDAFRDWNKEVPVFAQACIESQEILPIQTSETNPSITVKVLTCSHLAKFIE
jgi:hypothetical protein